MNQSYLVKTKRKNLILNFNSFNSISGNLNLTITRKFDKYLYKNECGTTLGYSKFNLLNCLHYELFDNQHNLINTITYYLKNIKKKKIFYYDNITEKLYTNKLPKINPVTNKLVYKFNRGGYKSSQINFQLVDADNNVILEFGKIDKTSYRLEYNSKFFTHVEAMSVVITRFHYI